MKRYIMLVSGNPINGGEIGFRTDILQQQKKSTLGHLILIVKEHGPWKETGNKSRMTFKKIDENIYASTT